MQSPIKQQKNQQSQNESSEASLAIINIVNNQMTNQKPESHQNHESQIYADEKENMASFGNLQIFQNTFENAVNDLNMEYPDKKDLYEPSLPFCDFQSFNYTGSSQFDMQTTPCLKSAAGTLPQTSRRDTASNRNHDIQQCLISNEKKRFSETGLSNVSEISRKSSKLKSRSIHNSRSLSRKSRDLYKDQISKIMKGNRNSQMIKAPTQKKNSQNSKNHEGSTFVSMSHDNSFQQYNEFGTLNESQYKNNDQYLQENERTTIGDCSITDDGTSSNIRSYIIHDSDRLNTQTKLRESQKSISESVDVHNNQKNADIHQIQEHNNIIFQKEAELRQLREQMEVQMKKNTNARNYIDQMFENNIVMSSQRYNSFQNADEQYQLNDVKNINYKNINLASDSELEDYNSDKISRDVLQMPRQIDKPFLEYSDQSQYKTATNKFNQTHNVNFNIENKQTLRNQQSLQEFQSQYSEHYNYPQHVQQSNDEIYGIIQQQNMNLHKKSNKNTQQLHLINQNSELDERQFSMTQNIPQNSINYEQPANIQKNLKILDQMKKSAKNNRTKACSSVSTQPLNMKMFRPKSQKTGNSVSSKNKNLRQSIAKVDSGLEKVVGRRGRQERQKPSSKTRIDFNKKDFQQLRSPSSKGRKSSKDSISKTRLQQKLKLLKESTSQQRSVKQPAKKIEMMKSFGNKSDQNQKYLEVTKQFGSSTNTRWQGFSEKFSPDILIDEIENQIIGKIDHQTIMKIPYNQIDQAINQKIQNRTLSDSIQYINKQNNYEKKNQKNLNLNKDLNLDETFKTQESLQKDKEMTFIQFLKHIQIYIQQEQQNQDIDQTNDSQKCLFRNLEYLKSKYNGYLHLQRSKINQQTLQTMQQVHSPKIQKCQKNGSSIVLNADLRSDQFPVLQTTISQDLRLMMNTNQSENTLDETFKRKINKNRYLDSSFRNDLQQSPSDIIKNQETVEDHSFRANPPISFNHANENHYDKNDNYKFFKQQYPFINNQSTITTRRDSVDNQKNMNDSLLQQQHQPHSILQNNDQKQQKPSFMNSIGHLKPRGSFALPPRDNQLQQSQAVSNEASQKHKQQIKYIDEIYKKVVLDNKKGLKKSRDIEKIKMDQLKQQAQEAVEKFKQFEDTKKQIKSFSQTMQNNQLTNQQQFVTFNKKNENIKKNQKSNRQNIDKNIMQQSQGMTSYSYPQTGNKDIEPLLYSDFYQNQDSQQSQQQHSQYKNYCQNNPMNIMRMQKTSSQDLEDHINEIKKLKEDLILPPRMNKRTNSTKNQINDFQNGKNCKGNEYQGRDIPQQLFQTIGAKNSSIESQPLFHADARYPSIAVSSSQQTELLNQVQILQQLIVDPKNMSMSQIKETLSALNQTAQELSKACQGIQDYANQLQKKHIMYQQNDQRNNQTANFQINDLSPVQTSDKQGFFSQIQLNENSPLVNVTGFQDRSGTQKDSKQEITFFTSSRDNLQSNQNLNSHMTIDSQQQKEQQKIDIQNQQNTFSAPFIQTQHTSFINTSENDNIYSSYSHSHKNNDLLRKKKQTEQRLITFSKNDVQSSSQHTHHVSSSKFDYQNTNTFPSQASYFLTSDQELDLKCTQNLPKEMLIKDQSEKEEMEQNNHYPYQQQRFVVNQNQSTDSMVLTNSQEEIMESTQRMRNVQKSNQHAKLFLIQDDSRSLVSQQMADARSFSQSPNYTLVNYKDKNEKQYQDGLNEELKLNFNYDNIRSEQLLHKHKKDELTSLRNLQDDSIHSSWIQNIQLNQQVQQNDPDYFHKNHNQIYNQKTDLNQNDDYYNNRENAEKQLSTQFIERAKLNNNNYSQINQLERQLNQIIQENPYDQVQNQRPPSSIYSDRPPSYIHADRAPSNTFVETSSSMIYGQKPSNYFYQDKPPLGDQFNEVQKSQNSQYRKVDEFGTSRTFESYKIEKEKQKSMLHYSQNPKSSFTQNPSKELLDFNSSSFISKTDAYLSQINHQQSYQNIIPSQEDENREYSGQAADRLIKNKHITTPESSNYKIIKENLLKHEVTLTPEEFEQYVQANLQADDIFGQNEIISQRSRQSYADVYDQYKNRYMQTQSSQREKNL